MLLHTIGAQTTGRGNDPWLHRYIFPNGELPSVVQLGRATEGLLVLEDWHNFGPDYDRTLMAWKDNFEAAWSDLAARYEFMVVEGAGGLYVPLIGTHFLVLDLIRWLHLPLAVVAKSGLGTINHTVLTIKAAQAAHIQVAGVILNRFPEKPGLAAQTNPQVIAALTGVSILGKLPEVSDLTAASGREPFLAALRPIAEQLVASYGAEQK